MIHTVDELNKWMVKLGAKNIGGDTVDNSFIYVPILHGNTVNGVITVGKQLAHAFSDSDVSLLTTLANAMSVALENARLFDETQRLFKAEQQRAAELAVINSIQQGMAEKLDFQAVVDLVGDKLREVFHTGDIGIRWYDAKANILYSPYDYEHGVRLSVAPVTPLAGGQWFKLMENRQPVVYNNQAEAAAAGVKQIPGTDASLCSVRVPILGGDRVLGSIILESFERENAYGDAEVRLLSTVAASMGVALENARLFDETQRLLKETEQRNSRAGHHQLDSAGPCRRARLPGDRRPGRRQVARGLRHARSRHQLVRREGAYPPLPVRIRAREAIENCTPAARSGRPVRDDAADAATASGEHGRHAWAARFQAPTRASR